MLPRINFCFPFNSIRECEIALATNYFGFHNILTIPFLLFLYFMFSWNFSPLFSKVCAVVVYVLDFVAVSK